MRFALRLLSPKSQHTLRLFLIDAADNIPNIYSFGTLDVRLAVTMQFVSG